MTADTDNAPPLLRIGSLSKAFPGQVALDRVHLEVQAGQVHALVGQNGSGKSTLIKILAGYHHPDPGAQVELHGRTVDIADLDERERRHLHVMHQDLGLVGSLNSIENLALLRGFHTDVAGRIRWRREAERAQALLADFGVSFDVRAPVATLTASERAILALARALQGWDEGEWGLLVLDEPTASLPRPEVDKLFDAVRRVAARGAGVIFVSHRLDEVFEIADHVTVLRDGRVAGSRPRQDLDHDQLVGLIVGRALDELYTPPAETTDAVLARIDGLWGDEVEDFSAEIRAGEVVGVAGLIGSGRDELPGLVFGSRPRRSGSVLVEGVAVPADPHAALAAGIGLVPADRARQGSIPAQTVRENITLPRLGPLWSKGRLSRAAERHDVSRWIDRVDLRPPEPERPLETLSGGNQQKAVLAKWLRTEPKLLILDEPTQGVDVGAKAAIYELLSVAAGQGMAVLVCSSEADELTHICDRVLTMRRGRISAELSGGSLDEDRLIQEIMR